MTATFGDMQDRISAEMERSDFATNSDTVSGSSIAPIQLAIQSAIAFWEAERFWFNETRSTVSTTAPVASVGTPNYALPTDCIEIDTLTLTVNGQRFGLDQEPWETIDALIGYTAGFGAPRAYAVFQQQLWVYPIPDAVYTLTMSYLKKLSTLSATTDTNAWMVEGEALIRNRAKTILYQGWARDAEAAALCEQLEGQSLDRLRIRTGKLLATGHVTPTDF